jgi:hypothetical protein
MPSNCRNWLSVISFAAGREIGSPVARMGRPAAPMTTTAKLPWLLKRM